MPKKRTYISKEGKHRDIIRDIIKDIETIGYRHSIPTVFDDWIALIAYAISNAVDKLHYDEREKQYLSTIKKYSKEERMQLKKLHEKLVDGFSQCLYEADLLGEIYHSLNLSNSRNGQFFTPMDIAKMMAKITIQPSESDMKKKGYVTICEPTCGSGVMVIAAAGVLHERSYSPSKHMCVLAVDNDIRCAMMTYIQLSYLGIPAVVVHGDSMLVKEYARFYTPIYILGGWLWKEQMSMLDGSCADDERLKCIISPVYAFLKYGLSGKGRTANE